MMSKEGYQAMVSQVIVNLVIYNHNATMVQLESQFWQWAANTDYA